MAFFDATQIALAEGKSVFYAELFELGFTSGAAWYWDGFGPLVAYSHTWEGAANFVQRSEIPFAIDDEAGDMTLTLSGVDADIVAKVRAEESEFRNRPITIWGQFFDEAAQLSGDRFFLFRGIMDVPTYGGSGAASRWISVPCEGEFTDRNTARFSMFSDVDQKGRFPGDRGLEYVYRYTLGVRRKWPQFT